MFERNSHTIELNGSREWDQRNGCVHSLCGTPEIPGFKLEQTRATSPYSSGAQRAPDGSSPHILKMSLTLAVTRARKLLSKFSLFEGVPSSHISRMRFLSVISLSFTRHTLIWEEDRCPFRSFQNNFSSDSAALQSFVTLSSSRLFKKLRISKRYSSPKQR